MRIVRVHNPPKAATKKRSNMATKRRRTTNKRRAAANPRRRRSVRRRRRNPGVVARARRVTINPRRRGARRHRRRNPSGMQIGQIFKNMIYGAGGAILTRVGAGAVAGLIPGSFATSPLAVPVVQAAMAATAVRWIGKKFFGPAQGDAMMIGGVVSAGLALADAYFPNIQQTLTGIVRAPIALVTPQQVAAAQAADAALAGYGYRDVEEVPDSVFAGLGSMGDVEDVPAGIFGNVY